MNPDVIFNKEILPQIEMIMDRVNNNANAALVMFQQLQATATHLSSKSRDFIQELILKVKT